MIGTQELIRAYVCSLHTKFARDEVGMETKSRCDKIWRVKRLNRPNLTGDGQTIMGMKYDFFPAIFKAVAGQLLPNILLILSGLSLN